ncbi:hypothetical protein SAMN05216349_1524 [Oribacterium sp. KHPX15]|nr:hypothetical protein SAMN05216349_1524 [Oribacterium sp. KHPX15]
MKKLILGWFPQKLLVFHCRKLLEIKCRKLLVFTCRLHEAFTPKKSSYLNKYYESKSHNFTRGLTDLSIETPYNAGDIVLIDSRPFGYPFCAMILEGRDQFDCCLPTILFKKPGTKEWRITALKHKMFYKDISSNTHRPMLSPLYRICKAEDTDINNEDFWEDESFLESLSKTINRSEERGSKVWNIWHDTYKGYDITKEEVLELFESIK